MRRRAVVGMVAVGLLAAGCGSTRPGSHDVPAPKELQSKVAMVRPAADLDYSGLASGSRAFGYALARKLAPGADEGNLVFSPASLEIAFSMLREGARGDTARSLDAVMGFPPDRQAAYNGLIHALRDPGPGNVVDVGNGLFLDRGYPVKESYLSALQKWYGAGVYQTDFPDQAVKDINAYVDENTHGRIRKLVGELDPADVFALVNTVYLNARWQTPFSKYETQVQPFDAGDGSTVQVKTMQRRGDAQLAEGDGWQALRMPYRGDRLSMEILLPSGQTDPLPLLSPAVLAAADKKMTTYGDVGITLPRWDTQNRFDNVADVLEGLGMSDVFGPAGDFTGITNDPKFDVHRVVHVANITVGEKGTVAAAATGLIAEAQSAPAPPPMTFHADHPFAYVILDNTTGTPLFEGIVSNPS